MNASPSRLCSGAAIAIVCLLACAGAARGQGAKADDPGDGPIIIGDRRPQFKWWDLQSFRTELEFYGQYQYDKQTTQGQPDLVEHDNLSRFTTNVTFESYIGHKNLIDLNCEIKLGYQYEEITSSVPGAGERDGSLADFYNIEALILGQSSVPVTAYARRDENLQSRDFAGTVKTTTTEEGAIANINSDRAPTRLQFFHRDQVQSDPLNTIDEDIVQDTFSIASYLRLTPNQRLDLNYTLDHIEETGTGVQDSYDRHDGTLTHTLDFGKDNRDDLRSSLRFYKQSGLYDQGILRLDEQLVLHHTDRLETRYNLTLDDETSLGAEQKLASGNASIRHRLFESLTSVGTVGGNYLEAADGSTSEDVYISGTLDYTKKVPYGRLDASGGVNFDHQDNSARGSDLFVIDEAHVFIDPLGVVINRQNILPASIVITDVTHIHVYVQGIDYQVFSYPDRVEIRRLFGLIANGQSVLISYDVGPQPASLIDTTSLTFTARYTFDETWLKGLSVYFQYLQTEHSLTSNDPAAIILDDVHEYKYGAEYHIGDLTLLAERRNHASTVSPYDETRLEARYDRRLDRDSALSLSVSDDVIDYQAGIDPADRVSLFLATGRWTQRLRSGLDLVTYLQYRDQRDTLSGNVHGLEEGVELHWSYRQTKMYGSFYNSMLQGNNGSTLTQTIVVGVTRSF